MTEGKFYIGSYGALMNEYPSGGVYTTWIAQGDTEKDWFSPDDSTNTLRHTLSFENDFLKELSRVETLVEKKFTKDEIDRLFKIPCIYEENLFTFLAEVRWDTDILIFEIKCCHPIVESIAVLCANHTVNFILRKIYETFVVKKENNLILTFTQKIGDTRKIVWQVKFNKPGILESYFNRTLMRKLEKYVCQQKSLNMEIDKYLTLKDDKE